MQKRQATKKEIARESRISPSTVINPIEDLANLSGYKLCFARQMISDLTDPPLSSVEQHGYEMGKEAVRLSIARLESNEDLPFKTKIFKTELVVKGSSLKQQVNIF